jgi:hypothetical protein
VVKGLVQEENAGVYVLNSASTAGKKYAALLRKADLKGSLGKKYERLF